VIRSNSTGSPGFKRTGEIGALCRIASNTIREVFPENAGNPVAISYTTAPNENRSVRGSNSSPPACSGDMYAIVPTAVPGLVRCASLITVGAAPSDAEEECSSGATLASPKSRIFACPRLVTKMFAGLMSR
jgi:hypothetical protein